MLKIVTKIAGAVLLLCGMFLFFVATVDMTSNVRIAGPMNAPPRDGLTDGWYLAADIECYVAAYIIAQLILFVGLWFVIQHFRRRRLT